MQVGTVETETEELKIAAKRRSRSVGGSRTSGGPGGGGSDNGGGGDSRDPRAPLEDADHPVGDKSRIVTYFLLLVVLMTFGGLIGAYVVIATNRALEWQPFDLPVQIWFSTAIIIACSITYELATRAVFARQTDKARKFLLATTILGGVFIASQLVVWLSLVNRGFYMRGNPYAGFFYILTAAHALHVAGGMVALGSVLLRSWVDTEYGPEIEYRRNLTRAVGWYWHFMGVLWIALFLLLGLWK